MEELRTYIVLASSLFYTLGCEGFGYSEKLIARVYLFVNWRQHRLTIYLY